MRSSQCATCYRHTGFCVEHIPFKSVLYWDPTVPVLRGSSWWHPSLLGHISPPLMRLQAGCFLPLLYRRLPPRASELPYSPAPLLVGLRNNTESPQRRPPLLLSPLSPHFLSSPIPYTTAEEESGRSLERISDGDQE